MVTLHDITTHRVQQLLRDEQWAQLMKARLVIKLHDWDSTESGTRISTHSEGKKSDRRTKQTSPECVNVKLIFPTRLRGSVQKRNFNTANTSKQKGLLIPEIITRL